MMETIYDWVDWQDVLSLIYFHVLTWLRGINFELQIKGALSDIRRTCRSGGVIFGYQTCSSEELKSVHIEVTYFIVEQHGDPL